MLVFNDIETILWKGIDEQYLTSTEKMAIQL